MRFDLSFWQTAPVRQQRSVACHETAHSLGIDHAPTPQSCVFWETWPEAPENIDEHDMWMVNDGPWRLLWASTIMPDRRSRNEFMSSPNGRFQLWMQSDGHLVLYDNGTAVWGTGRTTPWASQLVLQSDGNVVQYATDGWGTWVVCAMGTHGHPNSWFKVQDDGNMIVVDPYDRVLWSRFGGGQCQ